MTEDYQYYKNNLITDVPSLTKNQKLGLLLLKTIKNNKDNTNTNDDVDNNKGYIEKIINKDKEALNDKNGNDVYVLINKNSLHSLKDNNNYLINDIKDESNIELNNNKPNNNNNGNNLVLLKYKRFRRDGKDKVETLNSKRFGDNTELEFHSIVRIVLHVLTSELTSCQHVVFALLFPSC